jgi:hypothetical protein
MSVGRLRQVGISIAIGSCLAAGCGSEKSEEPAGAKSEEAAGAAAPATVETRQKLPDFDAMPTVELPGDFPDDVPRYPGARAVKAAPDPESVTESNWLAQFTAADDPATVYANLADSFAAQGWTTERADAPDGIMLYANKGDRSATYALGAVDGKTVMTLIIVERP